MLAATYHRLVLHSATFIVWALATGCATYWVLQISATSEPGNLRSTTAVAEGEAANANAAGFQRVLGAGQIAPVAMPANISNRFSLKGVVSGAAGKEAALIAIDDKPAKAFRVGSTIENGLVLQSASARKVTLSATAGGPALMTLEMPPLSN